MNKGWLVLCLLMCLFNGRVRSAEHTSFEDGSLFACRWHDVSIECKAYIESYQLQTLNELMAAASSEVGAPTIEELSSKIRSQIEIVSVRERPTPQQFSSASELSSSDHPGDSAVLDVKDEESPQTAKDSEEIGLSRSIQQKIHDRTAQYALSSACRVATTDLVLRTSVGQRHPELAKVCTAVAVDVALTARRDELSPEEAIKVASREVALSALCYALRKLMPKMPHWVQAGCSSVSALAERQPSVYILIDVIPRVVIDTCIDAVLR